MQGMTIEKIARTLGISPSTLYKKKAQFAEISEAIKNGAAEGEAVVSSKLFERAKAGNVVAMIFWLKARHGWRETGDPAAVNVNIGTLRAETAEAEQERLEEQRKLISLLTVDERRTYLELMERAARRQREGMPAIEVRPLTVEEIEAEAAELEAEG